MKTLADIKRRATPGTRLEVVEQTKRPVLVGTVRTIIDSSACSRHGTRPAKQRRCYDFTSSNTGAEVYCATWPTAARTRIIDADTFEYDLQPGPGSIRLRFLPPAVVMSCGHEFTGDTSHLNDPGLLAWSPRCQGHGLQGWLLAAGPYYPSLKAFYDERPDERRLSGEADYGVHWRIGGQHWPTWRVSYIEKTGELYALCQHGLDCPVVVLGVVPPDDPADDPGRAGGRGRYYFTLDKILDGWADPDISGHDLAWIERKLASARRG
jgi:hypothetical protein